MELATGTRFDVARAAAILEIRQLTHSRRSGTLTEGSFSGSRCVLPVVAEVLG